MTDNAHIRNLCTRVQFARLSLLTALCLSLLAFGAASTAALEFNFQITKFDVSVIKDEAKAEFTKAGGHPYALDTEIEFGATTDNLGNPIPDGAVRNVHVETPAGLAGNPLVLERCEEAALAINICPADSQVGIITFSATDHSFSNEYPIYNMVPAPGVAAELGFNVEQLIWAHLEASVRPDGAITISSREISQIVPLAGVSTRIWGVPADDSHDADRGKCLETAAEDECPSGEEERAFLSLPTSCTGPQSWNLRADSWQDPPGTPEATATDSEPGNEDCGGLKFEPTLQARPTTNRADSPSGLDLELELPQSDQPGDRAQAHLKDTVLTLPEGLVINPAAANGLGACSPSEIGLGDSAEPSCPNDSKIGTLAVDTPAVDHPLPGALYIATPLQNPFGSLYATYIVIDDPQSGVVIKLAAKLEANPVSGRLTATLNEAPQQPFEALSVHLKSGSTAPLRTPALCGPYATTATLTPWSAPDSGPPVQEEDNYAIAAAPGGGPCPTSAAAQPHAPAFEGGTASPLAGAFTPLVINLHREDGSQQWASLDLSLPPGLLAKLADTPRCPEATLAAAATRPGRTEQAAPSCPPASRVGTATVATGAGPTPYYASGTAYLTGPYKGAPLGVAVIFPAVAGPFDLGTVVVRNALLVDPVSAQASAKSDPFPTILGGIPLDVRSISFRVDKPDFIFNPTSCDPMALGGTLLSTQNQVAILANRFQVAECAALAFKPKLSLGLKGSTKRGGHPALNGTMKMPGGGANLARLSVALPHSEFLEQAHIRTICTRVQFAASACPPGSVYGHIAVTAPRFSAAPFEGPVYLRSSDHNLPDLILALHGPPDLPAVLNLSGRIDTLHGGIRATFESVPDVPFEKAVLTMQGGKKGLLVNSRNICNSTNKATVQMDGQNGKAHDSQPILQNSCKKAKKHHKRHG